MGIFLDLEKPFIGRVKKKENTFSGSVIKPFLHPVWIGTKKGSDVKRMMRTEEAQNWVQGGVDRSVKLYIRKQDLDKL